MLFSVPHDNIIESFCLLSIKFDNRFITDFSQCPKDFALRAKMKKIGRKLPVKVNVWIPIMGSTG